MGRGHRRGRVVYLPRSRLRRTGSVEGEMTDRDRLIAAGWEPVDLHYGHGVITYCEYWIDPLNRDAEIKPWTHIAIATQDFRERFAAALTAQVASLTAQLAAVEARRAGV